MFPKNESPIVKCSHCRQILSAKEFDSHECNLPLTDIKRIPVVYFQDDSINGERIMTGRGVDGVLYSFVVVPRTPISYMRGLSDDSYHEPKTDDKLPERFTTKYISLEHEYCLRNVPLQDVDQCLSKL